MRCELGRVAQSVTCLATEASLTDYEIISTVNLLPSAESFKKDCVHEVLVNCLGKSVVK